MAEDASQSSKVFAYSGPPPDSEARRLNAKLVRDLERRCKAAEIPLEKRIARKTLHLIPYENLVVTLPRGRSEKQFVLITTDEELRGFLASKFESVRFLEGYWAVFSYEERFIEAAYGGVREASCKGNSDENVKIGSCESPALALAMPVRYTGPGRMERDAIATSIRISNTGFATQEQALRHLKAVTGAISLQMDIKSAFQNDAFRHRKHIRMQPRVRNA